MTNPIDIQRLTAFICRDRAYHIIPGPYEGRSLCLVHIETGETLAQFEPATLSSGWRVRRKNRNEAQVEDNLQCLDGGRWCYSTAPIQSRYYLDLRRNAPQIEALIAVSEMIIEGEV